jgi:hypothetical protein
MNLNEIAFILFIRKDRKGLHYVSYWKYLAA